MSAFIHSHSVYIPKKCVKNEDLTQFPKPYLSLIEQKTGVKSRFHSEEGELSSDLGIKAALKCLDKKSKDAKDIDFLIFASSTFDRTIPATATKVANSIGATNAFAFDVNSVCSGGLSALGLGQSLIESGAANNVLIVVADVYSKILNPKDFSTYPYFGDAGVSFLLSKDTSSVELGRSVFRTDGSAYETITLKAGATEIRPNNLENPNDAYFYMKGRDVYEFATTKVPLIIEELLEKSKIEKSSISQVVLHQANINIVNEIADNLKLSRSLFFTNLQKYGNTAGASSLVALSEYLEENPDATGNLILSAFGAGLSLGALHIKIG